MYFIESRLCLPGVHSGEKPVADLVGTRELARRLGLSPSAVTKAKKEGRIQPAATKGTRKLYDVDDVRRKWAPLSTAPPDSPPPDSEGAPGELASDNERYAKARADKEEALAAQEALELETLRGSLLPRDEITLSFTQFLRVANQSFSGLPAKLLSRYPGLTPDGRNFLIEEMRGILDGLAEWEPTS